jgi:hypothetical protein
MNFDVESIRDRIINSLRAKVSWADVLPTSTLDYLVRPFAEESSRLALYGEYLLKEAKWKLAKNPSSILAQATLQGYLPKRKVGATGVLRVSTSETFDSTPVKNVIIPKNTIFSNGTYDYTTIDSYILSTADDYIDVDIVQGTPLSENFTATGLNFEEFTITNDSVENTYYEVYVNGILYTEITDIREAEATDAVYQVINAFDFSEIKVRFGNNINGKRVNNGDTIGIFYYETVGSLGNVSSSNQVTDITSTIYDIDGDKVDVYVTNTETLVGGSDYEDTETVRTLAPNVGQSVNSATTITSYKTLIDGISFVYNSVVSGALEYNEDNGFPYSNFIPTQENRIRISAFTDSGDQLSEVQKQTIIDELEDRKAPTDILSFEDVEFIRLQFNITAYAQNRNIVLSELRNQIESQVAEEYSLFNWDFKKSLYSSDYIAFIDSISDSDGLPIVDHHNTTLKLVNYVDFGSAYVADIALLLPSIKESSIDVYVKDEVGGGTYELIGTDDGSGGFTAEAGYDLTGSSVNYTTGIGIINIDSGLAEPFANYQIKIVYEIDNEDILPVSRNQIIAYEEANITGLYL